MEYHKFKSPLLMMVMVMMLVVMLIAVGFLVKSLAAETYTVNGMIIPVQMQQQKVEETDSPKGLTDMNAKYVHQVPQQLDCQEINVDERYLGGKVWKRKICFYDVTIGSNNRHLVMWHVVGGGEAGFVAEVP